MLEAVNEIIGSQAEWAQHHGVLFDNSHVCRTVDDNLFMPLNPETLEEFEKGAGNELGTPDTPGSMASLRSSSALAVNVFDPWRAADIAALGALVVADPLADRLRFEVTYPTGLRGIPPHLDVVIDRPGGVPVAIESKFSEMYAEARNEFRPSYFEKPGLWDGFEQTRKLASAIAYGSVRFEHLGAAQLIKHALGLKHAHGPEGFRLLYLWYEWPGGVADIHSNEFDRLAEVVREDFDLAALTYQQLFDRLRDVPEPRPGYLAYLEDRYFSPR